MRRTEDQQPMRFVEPGMTAAAIGIGMALLSGAASGRGAASEPTAKTAKADWSHCLAQPNPVDCALRREARLLSALQPVAVHRSGRALQFKWPHRPSVTLGDTASGDRYVILGTLGSGAPNASGNSWLLAQWTTTLPPTAPALTAPSYWVVAPGNPSPLPLAGRPWLAPQGRLALVVNDATAERAAGQSVDLWQRAGERWSRIFHYENDAGGHFEFVAWRTDSTAARLQWHAQSAQTGQTTTCQSTAAPVQLRDGPYGWDFVPAPPWAPCQPTSR
jgi:hypothetical protein